MYIGTIAIRSDTSFNWLLFAGCLVGLAVTLIVRLSYATPVRPSVRSGNRHKNAPAQFHTKRSIMIIGIVFCLYVAITSTLAHSAALTMNIADRLQESLFEAGFNNPSVSPGSTLDNAEFVGEVQSIHVKGHLVKRTDGVYDVYIDSPSRAPTTIKA